MPHGPHRQRHRFRPLPLAPPGTPPGPERASRVRGLASQHAFLAAPHLELTVNLRYSTAIAWSLVEAARLPLPDQHDHLAQARVWRQVFQPHGRLHEFIDAWQRCIGSLSQVA